ncbi:MAG: rhodanese-like domain-containing protein [Alphaproteobacteria bacterium]|nr:rhodanese-like domain-containing protein [Alphaproteobacteria bacterium]
MAKPNDRHGRNWLAAGLLMLAACAGERTPPGIDAMDALERIEQAGLVIIDIRAPQEARERGQIAGAHAIPYPTDDAGREEFLGEIRRLRAGDDRPILLVCRIGETSKRAALWLADAGLDGVFTLTDGYEGNAIGPGLKLLTSR